MKNEYIYESKIDKLKKEVADSDNERKRLISKIPSELFKKEHPFGSLPSEFDTRKESAILGVPVAGSKVAVEDVIYVDKDDEDGWKITSIWLALTLVAVITLIVVIEISPGIKTQGFFIGIIGLGISCVSLLATLGVIKLKKKSKEKKKRDSRADRHPSKKQNQKEV